MMIPDKMLQALNRQVTSEFGASHKYLAMSCCFMDMGLKIFAKRFFDQANEERTHALKIAKYIGEVGGKVTLDAIPKPKSDYTTVESMVQAALESEQTVTNQINELVALADAEKDYATRSFLQWFVDEQVEEVASMQELLQWVKMAGEKNLFFLEARLGQAMAEG